MGHPDDDILTQIVDDDFSLQKILDWNPSIRPTDTFLQIITYLKQKSCSSQLKANLLSTYISPRKNLNNLLLPKFMKMLKTVIRNEFDEILEQ